MTKKNRAKEESEALQAAVAGEPDERAEVALEALLRVEDPLDLRFLERDVRQTQVELTVRQCGRLGVHTLHVLSLVRNGFVREAALREILRRRDSRSTPFVLLRLQDPVAPIRAEASAALDQIPSDLGRCILLLEWMIYREHPREFWKLSLLHRHALYRGGLNHAQTMAEKGIGVVAAVAREVVLKEAAVDQHALMTLAVEHPELFRSAAHVSRLEMAKANTAELVELAKAGTKLLSPPALLELEKRQFEGLGELLQRGLYGPRRMRNLAQYLLSNSGVPVAEVYAAQASARVGKRLETVLHGLAETGTEEHAHLALRYADHPSARVRRAALRAARTLAPEVAVDALRRGLRDGSPKVVREALSGLRGELVLLDIHAFVELCTQLPAEASPLYLTRWMSKWKALEILLTAAGDPRLGRLAERMLRVWTGQYNRRLTAPKEGELERCRALFTKVQHIFEHQVREDLRVTLALAG